jgi:crotonobetainyl-CoA:carnitine CoA-transferase CaiB-like acyl-CoA transferase
VPLGVVVAEVGSLKQALESELTRSRDLVVTLGDGSQALRGLASPLKFDGYSPKYGLPPTLNEHGDEIFGKALA